MKFFDIPEPVDKESSRFNTPRSVRSRAKWFIRVRWVAIISATALLFMGKLIFPLLNHRLLLIPIFLLTAFNLSYLLFVRKIPIGKIRSEFRFVKVQMAVDLILLTVIMHFSGGLENPLFFIYFIHVIIASIIFTGRETYHIALFGVLVFGIEVLFSENGINRGWALFEHHHILSTAKHLHDVRYLTMVYGTFTFVILFTAFITSSMMRRYRQIRDRLLKNHGKLITAGKEKLEFFRFVAHEMKSPIAAAHTSIDTMAIIEKDNFSEMSIDLLKRAQNRLTQSLEMVKELSDLTQGAESGTVSYEKVEAISVINEVIEMQQSADRRGIECSFGSENSECMFCTNRAMFEKILTNLVSNAFRYSHEGGKVHVSLANFEKWITITIKDNGIGMEQSDIEKIFDQFYRSPGAKKFNQTGTGLGMSIVKSFIEKLGGKLSVSSQPAKGSEFTLTLPILWHCDKA